MPAPLLNGEHTGTAGATIAADGEFGVAVPLIVPPFVIVVPAVTSPVTRLCAWSVAAPSAERTSPRTCAPASVIPPLPRSRAALPWLPPPYGPTAESKLSTSAVFAPTDALSRPITPVTWTTFPPASGEHWRTPAIWGFYRAALNPRQVVHNEEHGGVILWWGPQTPASTVRLVSDRSSDNVVDIVLELGGAQLSRLVQNMFWNRQLAHVVQQC